MRYCVGGAILLDTHAGAALFSLYLVLFVRHARRTREEPAPNS